MRGISLFGTVLLVLACTSSDGRETRGSELASAPAAVETRPAAAARAAAGDSVLYLDVRTVQEYRAGHVQGAVLIPYDQMEARWRELEAWRDRPVVVYCRTGRRAGVAIEVLQAHGFSKLTNGVSVPQMAARGLQIVTGE